jgi:outer membrane protein TolC
MSKGGRNALAAVWVLGLLTTTGARAQEPEPLTLKRVVALAVQNSRELALARIQYAVAKDSARFDRAAFLPNLYTGSGAAYTYGFPQTPNGGAPSVFNLAYEQAFFNRPLRGAVRAAEERAEGQRLGYEQTRDAVILRAASAFLELAKVRRSLDLLRTERESAQKVLEVTRERAGAGLELPIEITKAELTQARIEQRVVALEGREEDLEEELRNLTGLPADRRIELSSEEWTPTPQPSAAEMVEQALTNNPSLKIAERERLARQHILNGERGRYWPSIDIVGQYSLFSKVNNFEEFFRNFQRNNVNVGVAVRIPIFSSRASAGVALARSQLQEAEVDVGNRRAALASEVREKARRSRGLDAAREVARLELKLAQENLGIVQAKFGQGRANLAGLEQARLDESEKWLAFLDAEFDRQRAELELLKTTGQLAQVFQ